MSVELDIPDLTVVVRSENEPRINVTQIGDSTVNVTNSGETKVNLTSEGDVRVSVYQDGETTVNIIQDAAVNLSLTEPSVTTLVTGSYLSFAESSISASYAATASYVISGGESFPYTGDAEIYGTLNVTSAVTSSVIDTNKLVLSIGSLNLVLTGSITTGVFGISEYILPYISTIDYSGAIVEYIANRETGTRIGMIMATWIGNQLVFSDVSSADVGDTSDITFNFLQIGNEFRLRVNSAGSGSGLWNIQTLFRLFPRL